MRGLEQIPWLYDAFMSLADRGRFGRWRTWLVRGATGRVVEIGCGTGRNLPRYGRGRTVVAIDPARDALLAASRRAPHVPLVQARAEALPFRDGAFDTAVCSLVLCSVDDPHRAVTELRRVLAPGGTLRAVEHVRARAPWAARIQDLVQPGWTWLTGSCHPNRATEETVRRAGFEIDPTSLRASGTLRRFLATPTQRRRSPGA